jgi:hypothetical protein
MLHRRLEFALLVAIAAATPAAAQHAGDIYVELQGNRIVTGQVGLDGSIDLPVRVFPAAFGLDGFKGFTDLPGFDSHLNEFEPDQSITFNILAPLCRWTGNGLERVFGETITMSYLGSTRTTGDCIVPGFSLAVQPQGNWHRHFNFVLNPGFLGERDPGVYFLELELAYSPLWADPSHPFWIVFNHESNPVDHIAAIAWAEENLADTYCPADIDDSGAVDVFDLLSLLSNWGLRDCHPADVNHSGTVEIFDLLEIIEAWGPCPAGP